MENLKKQGITKIELFFQDEMRYGLISNYRRSWSKIGTRTELKNQQEFSNRYLYSTIAPLSGNSFHLIGLGDADGLHTKIFLKKFKEEYPNTHIVMVWDNAPFHKLKALQKIPGITIVPLPPYSPQLNPSERFFEEVRKSTANRIFENIDMQEKEIEQKVIKLLNDKPRLTQLTRYDWILKQWDEVF